jgi:nucleoside-diphosphate-sugar epimerase
MRVIVAGATGALGVPIVHRLVAAGHAVSGITRTESGAERLRALGADAIGADALHREELLNAVRGREADAVLHELTALKKAPVRHAAMRTTDALRTQGTSNLLEVAERTGARRFITQSMVFGYGYRDHGDVVLTEESPFGQLDGSPFDEHVAAMASAERQAFEADGIDAVALRYGLLYGDDVDTVARMLRRRSLPVARRGGVLPLVHHQDAAAATVAALERGRAGQAYNVVDDTPATFRDLVEGIAAARHVPGPLVLPGRLLRAAAPYGGRVLSGVSLRVSHEKAGRDLGWSPRYPSFREGLARNAAERP